MWNDGLQKYNDALVKRQEVLATAWAKVKGRNLDDAAFKKTWLKEREAALKSVGMEVGTQTDL
jgi:hypothetical protein